MFDKPDDMRTDKSAGSPAFMPPELCVPKHGHVSGRAADIWSMGVTLYCLIFGRIPFEKFGMLELYQSIREDSVEFEVPVSDDLRDILLRLLEKDPEKRITIEQLREHPWVTMKGTDPLLPTEENVAVIVEPTDEEVDAAITGNMGHLVTVVRAVKRFKQLLFRKRPERMESILGGNTRIVQPPLPIRPSALRLSKSQDTYDRRPIEGALTAEGIHRGIDIKDHFYKSTDYMFKEGTPAAKADSIPVSAVGEKPSLDLTRMSSPEPAPLSDDFKTVHDNMSSRPLPPKSPPISIPTLPAVSTPTTPTIGKGHAHDPLEDTLFLNIGTGEDFAPSQDDPYPIVSESPSNVDINVYETAYQEEIARIMAQNNTAKASTTGARDSLSGTSTTHRRPTLYLTRRVENIKSLRDKDIIVDAGRTRDELKASIKSKLKKAQKTVDDRAEMQRLEGKEDLLSRSWRNLREVKGRVDEAREIVREEERRDGKRPGEWEGMNGTGRERSERSRSSHTPRRRTSGTGSVVGSPKQGSRSATPVSVGKA
jgi:[calcium/calmodulin-dependent protein kinase] kinase